MKPKNKPLPQPPPEVPKPLTSIDPLYRIRDELNAICELAATRKFTEVNAALGLVKYISHNDCLFILMQLRKEASM